MSSDILGYSEDSQVERARSISNMTDSRSMVTDIASRRDIQRYLDHLRARRCSPSTLKTIRSTLHQLAARADRPLLQLDVDDIEAWQAMRARRLTSGSLRTQLNAVQNFYKWALRHELIERDPCRLVEPPRVPRRQPRPIREEHLRAALDGADPVMKAILGLAAFAGLRAKEIAGLDWSDLWLGEHPQLYPPGKGDVVEPVDISPTLQQILTALRPRRRGPVILRADGEPGRNTPTRISQMANRYLHNDCDLPDTLHSLRHRFVTRVYRYRRSIRDAQRAARHANITTTAGYTAIDEQEVRDAIRFAGDIRPAS